MRTKFHRDLSPGISHHNFGLTRGSERIRIVALTEARMRQPGSAGVPEVLRLRISGVGGAPLNQCVC